MLFGVIVSALWNIGGIASIMPFMSALAQPDAFLENPIASWAYETLGVESADAFLLWAGMAVLVLFITGNMLLAIVTWLTVRFARIVALNLTTRMFDHYLSQDYEFYLKRNSSELIKNVLGETNDVATNVVRPMMDLVVEGVLSATIIGLLVAIDPLVAAIAAGALGGAYAVVFTVFRRTLNTASRKRVKHNRARFGITSDAFGAIKEMKLRGTEKRYMQVLATTARRYERTKARVQAISKLPKYGLETIAFGGMLTIALVLFAADRSAGTVLPLISAYALAGYRLMPALQRLFAAAAKMRGSSAVLALLDRELSSPRVEVPDAPSTPVPIRSAFRLEEITFNYPSGSRPALAGISIEIAVNSTIGIAGPTGCGKTTLIDVILGLLVPQDGRILADDTPITDENRRGWQQNFGYVPQFIYLSDTTIARNIAFGVEPEEIDQDRVDFVARLANLHDFVVTLDEGYETVLGERGVRLSGGQRQRVGIARALYHDPAVLVFDEATSALDSHTETAVMEAINNLMHRKTILIVAHRLSTLKSCDEIFVLKDGSVDARGTYEELLTTHPHFAVPENEAGDT